MSVAHGNHYVPTWYQKGFSFSGEPSLYYLDINPERIILPDGREVKLKDCHYWGPKKRFSERDLYTTLICGVPNDEIEKYLFGEIDRKGALAIRSLIDNDYGNLHRYFLDLFSYLDAQKIRTPKGLDWVRSKYPKLTQLQLMIEMQALRQMNCTMWIEAVREIVSAEESGAKFIVSDHPVATYNYACAPDSAYCKYPDEPSIQLKGSQTIFPLDHNHCLILTNLEYAEDPDRVDPLVKRTNARSFGQTIARTDTMIRVRKLKEDEVAQVNYVLKNRARKYISAANKEWLFPEKKVNVKWGDIRKVLLPPKNEIYQFGGELYIGHKNGAVSYQDAFGRTTKESSFLTKSIRERNIIFANAIVDILGLSKGKTWIDVRRELSDNQVAEIYKVYDWLWPKETNLIDLLPKYDSNVSRALFMGLVDPRVVLNSIASCASIVDEIILISPFIIPGCLKPEMNPINSPAQYKQVTIKNVFLLMQLMPFINAGIVNMIPDPLNINPSLREQIFNLAKNRMENVDISEKDGQSIKSMLKDDLKRSMLAFPDEKWRQMIKSALPELSAKETEAIIAEAERIRMEDPLALLQPLPPGDKGSQLLITQLSPNLELGLFLAQVTGSFIVTDNEFRWAELVRLIESLPEGKNLSSWDPLVKYIANLKLIYEVNPIIAIEINKQKKMKELRDVFRKICVLVRDVFDNQKIQLSVKDLIEEIRQAYEQAKIEFDIIKNELKTTAERPSDLQSINLIGRINMKIPTQGLTMNEIHRLLVSYGGTNYSKYVPMIMFISNSPLE